MFIDRNAQPSLTPFGEAEPNQTFRLQDTLRSSERSRRVWAGLGAIDIPPLRGESPAESGFQIADFAFQIKIVAAAI
jgi:hypothetical protein